MKKRLLKISGITTFGSVPEHRGKPLADPCVIPEVFDADEAAKENNPPSSANNILLSPKGSAAIAQVNNNIYFVTLPKSGKSVSISVADAKNAAFPSKLLTEIGGEFPSWQADGKTIQLEIRCSAFHL